MTGKIGSEVLALLRDRVTSHDRLEILIFLHAHRPEAWSMAALGERIYVPLDHIAEALDALTRAGLVVREDAPNAPHYRYSAREPLHRTVEELAGLLVERRATIMSIMSANAIERVRSKAPSAFVDAFILRKKTDDD